MPVIYGINPVREALKARGRKFEYIAVARERNDRRVHDIVAECRRVGIPVRPMPRTDMDRLAATNSHQGVLAVSSEKEYTSIEDLLANRRGSRTFVVVLDGVEDPHNLGAILRTADAAGVDGIVIPERRAVGVNATVAKSSAGAVEHVPVAKVTNISRTIEELKKNNVWTVGLDERGDRNYDEIDYDMDCALVLGAEGHGLHDLVRKTCDFVVKIPMQGQVASLNVSVAAGVVMYEVARQRRQKRTTKGTEKHRGKER
jgi:23S rRNA (guanosine2251-2'-O)-methyltransferase